jgi:sorbitol-specific phosphotransferase system component IIBC
VCTVIGYKYYSSSGDLSSFITELIFVVGDGAPKKKVTKRRSSKKSSSKAAAEAKSKEPTKGKKEEAADESSKGTADKDILQKGMCALYVPS